MEFYERIARHYDDIFPISDTLKRFLDSLLADPPADSVLDAGCSTGTIPLYLASKARSVVGVDLDPAMIGIARSRITGEAEGRVAFRVADMNRIDETFGDERFSLVLCLGNTLVHLTSLEAIGRFLQRVARLLMPDGRFVFQILNYERILGRRINELPLIDNPKVCFERCYGYRSDSPLLDFQTKLTIKATGETMDNSVELYPLTKGELEGLLPTAGLKALRWYGDYAGSPYGPESDLLVGVLSRANSS